MSTTNVLNQLTSGATVLKVTLEALQHKPVLFALLLLQGVNIYDSATMPIFFSKTDYASNDLRNFTKDMSVSDAVNLLLMREYPLSRYGQMLLLAMKRDNGRIDGKAINAAVQHCRDYYDMFQKFPPEMEGMDGVETDTESDEVPAIPKSTPRKDSNKPTTPQPIAKHDDNAPTPFERPGIKQDLTFNVMIDGSSFLFKCTMPIAQGKKWRIINVSRAQVLPKIGTRITIGGRVYEVLETKATYATISETVESVTAKVAPYPTQPTPKVTGRVAGMPTLESVPTIQPSLAQRIAERESGKGSKGKGKKAAATPASTPADSLEARMAKLEALIGKIAESL